MKRLVTGLIAVLTLASCTFNLPASAVVVTPSPAAIGNATPTISASPTVSALPDEPNCVFGNWETREMPEQTYSWRIQLYKVGLTTATDVETTGLGETSICLIDGQWKETGWGAGSHRYFSATIPVDNIDNTELVGTLLTKVLTATEIAILPQWDPEIQLVFRASRNENATLHYKFRFNQAKQLLNQGLSGAKLLEALTEK